MENRTRPGTYAVTFPQGCISAVVHQKNAILKSLELEWLFISDSSSILSSFSSYSASLVCLRSISAQKVMCFLNNQYPDIFYVVSQELGDVNMDYKSLLYYTTLGAFGSGLTSCGLGDMTNNTVISFNCPNSEAVLNTYDTFEWGVSLTDQSDNSNELTCDLYSVVIRYK